MALVNTVRLGLDKESGERKKRMQQFNDGLSEALTLVFFRVGVWLVRAATLPSVWVLVVLPVYWIAFSVSVPSMEDIFYGDPWLLFYLQKTNFS